jgi:MFS family permease
MVAFLDRQVIALLVAPIRADLHVSDTQISLLQGFAFALLYTTCGIPIGYAVDRYSRRLVIFFGVLIWALAASGCGLVTGFGWLLFARIFVGMGEAALGPAAYAILGDMFDRSRLSFAIGVYSIGSVLGSSGALLIGSLLVAWTADGMTVPLIGHLKPWQSVLFLTGLPGLLLCWAIFLIPEPPRGRAPRIDDDHRAASSWMALGRLVSAEWRFFACHLAGFSCFMALAYTGLSWMPTVLNRVYGWTIADVGRIYGPTMAVTGITGLLLNGHLTDTLFARGRTDAHLRYYLYGAVVVTVFGAGAAAMPRGGLFIAMLVPAQIFCNFIAVAAAAVQVVTPSPLRGKVAALYLMVISLFGLIVGPSLTALIADYIVGEQRIGVAMSCVFALLAPASGICFLLGLKPMRDAVARAA